MVKSFSLLAHLLLSFVLILLAPCGEALARQDVVVSESRRDIDGDGTKERIQIVMDRGERKRDTEPWCGNGEKWEGEFRIRIWKGKTLLSNQSLNELMSPEAGPAESLFFWAPRFALVFADYNGDGRSDFNLGQYRSCNGNHYQLFTIRADGWISRLPVKNGYGFFVSPPNKVNSTRLIRVTGSLVRFPFYDNTAGTQRTGRYRWDGSEFVPAEEQNGKGSSPGR